MKFTEITESVKIALNSIRSNKVRSSLAALGVVVGISVVILMGWALSALDAALNDTINLMGEDVVYIDKFDWSGSVKWEEVRQRKNITLHQAEEIVRLAKTPVVATYEINALGITVKYKDNSINTASCSGVLSNYSETPTGEIATGRFFSEFEANLGAKVAIIGYNINKTLFPNDDAIGKEIKVNGRKFTVIGVNKKHSTMMMDFLDNIVHIPLRSYYKIFGGNQSYTITLRAGSPDKIPEMKAEVEGLMRSIRNLKPGMENDFSMNESKQFEEMMANFRMYVWGIGLGMTVLSFIVGIIGVMNIMFVSVVERTKEIGIRKALGAPRASILTQFIVEATVLCFIGAIVALLVCTVLVFAIGTIVPMIMPALSFLSPFMPVNLFIIATVVSVFVGICAGFVPAYRAAKLDVVDALRFD